MRNNQAPSAYGIYHNALPFYLDRVDICQTDSERENFAAKWIQDILRQDLSIQSNASDFVIVKMRHLYFESRNLERTKGAKTFGFGYPMLIDTHDNELLVAPIFIWLVSLEAAQTKVDSWIMRFGPGQHILPNYNILKYLMSKYGIDWKAKAEVLTYGRAMNAASLQEFCSDLSGQLNFENDRPATGIKTMPALDDIGAYAHKGVIHWSGLLGLFPPQLSMSSHHDDKTTQAIPNESMIPDGENLRMSLLSPSPFQATILETVARNRTSIVETFDKSAVSDAVINLLLNSLSNGEKVLVVSERAPVLKSVQASLARFGLNQLHFLLDDSLNDKMPMLELLRVAADGFSRRVPHNEKDFVFKKHKFQREKKKVNDAYECVRKNIFQNYNWPETVGLYLASQQIEGKELLNSQLNPNEFKFNDLEYFRIKEGVVNSRLLFDKVKTLSHPLNALHEKNFLEFDVEESYRDITKKVDESLEKARELHRHFILLIDSYTSSLKDLYEEKYLHLHNLCQSLHDKLLSYTDSLGTSFTNAVSTGFSFSSWFSGNTKSVRNAQADVARDWQHIVDTYQKHPYFDMNFLPCRNGEHIQKTEENLALLTKAVNTWHDRIDINVQEEVSRLNNKTTNQELDFQEKVSALENALDVLLEGINELALYQKSLENKTLTLVQRQKYLESIIEQIETSQLNMRDFGSFYQWQKLWLNLGTEGQKVVRALIKVKPLKWKEAFDSWFLYHVLMQNFSYSLPLGEPLVENYSEAVYTLKPLLLNQIIDLWQSRQIEAVKTLKQSNRKSYRLVFEKQGQQEASKIPLFQLMEMTQNAISTFLPVLFVTPQVAMESLSSIPEFYNLVIFLEADSLEAFKGVAISRLSKKQVIFGAGLDSGDMQFMHLAQKGGAASIHAMHRASEDEFISGLEGTLFSGFQAENVEGRFDELEGTNDVEAQHIVRLLNQVKQSPQRIYPTVGIVTFTKAQRDLISTYLLKLKQLNTAGSEKILQLERNGLGVFYLDELFGQQFDILIISCTIGQIDLEGNLSRKLMLMNSEEMVRNLEMLVRHQARHISLVHSLPESAIARLAGRGMEKGTWLMANYIRFIEAVMNGNQEKVDVFRAYLGSVRQKSMSDSLFIDQLEKAMANYFDAKLFVQNCKMGNLMIPLALKLEKRGEPLIAIHPDGFFAEMPFTCGFWENEQRRKLKDSGRAYLTVSSGNWFKNPFNEARILASQIIKAKEMLAKNIQQKVGPSDVRELTEKKEYQ